MDEVENNTMKMFGMLEKNVQFQNGGQSRNRKNKEVKVSEVTSKKADVFSVLIVFGY